MPPLPTVRTFVPEQWGQIDLFRKFHPGTHQLDKKTRKALSGVGNHLSKGILLHDLAMKMAPNLKIDRQEMETRGYSPALYARELSAVVESIFLELYSSVDCARRVVTFIYKRCRGVPELDIPVM